MSKTEKINKQLYQKMEAEFQEFLDSLEKKPPKEIITASYEKVFKEDILMSVFENNLPDEQAKALLGEKMPLDSCYRKWLKREVTYMEELRECVQEQAKTLAKRSRQMER